MTLEATRDYRLRWMDFDRYGRIQPAAILDIFQDMTTLHAEEIGIGREALLDEGVIWVVTRTRVEITSEPEHFQVVTVRTWPHSLSRFSFMRDFTMRGEDGMLLAKASQEWILIDEQSRKFASPKDYYHGPTDFCEERAFLKKPRKMPDFDTDGLTASTVTPSYSDIDLNGHVNNAKYINYVYDALNPGPEGTVKAFQLDYRYEVLPGKPLDIYTLVEEGRVLSKGVREDGKTAFTCVIELR